MKDALSDWPIYLIGAVVWLMIWIPLYLFLWN